MDSPRASGHFYKIKEPKMSEAREYTKFIPQELKGRITHNKYKQKDTEPDMKGTLCVKGMIVNFGTGKTNGPMANTSISRYLTLIGRINKRMLNIRRM